MISLALGRLQDGVEIHAANGLLIDRFLLTPSNSVPASASLPQFTEALCRVLRTRFARLIIVAGLYDIERSNRMLSDGYTDFVAFGRQYIAIPDLPYRLANGLPRANFGGSTRCGEDAHGYSDYPARTQREEEAVAAVRA